MRVNQIKSCPACGPNPSICQEYPLDIVSIGDDVYQVMSRGHHHPEAFIKAVEESPYNEWGLGMPDYLWFKAVPCDGGVRYFPSQGRGSFPVTYAQESPKGERYRDFLESKVGAQ